MKQHLGTSQSRVITHVQYAYTDGSEKLLRALTPIPQQLAQQLADFQKQLAMLTAGRSLPSPNSLSSNSKSTPGQEWAEGHKASKPLKNPSSVPMVGYCNRCGEDGHIKTHCENSSNSALVAAKKKQFTAIQQRWQKSSTFTRRPLN